MTTIPQPIGREAEDVGYTLYRLETLADDLLAAHPSLIDPAALNRTITKLSRAWNYALIYRSPQSDEPPF